jgi:uncharacterized membrane protein YidH (DUF202 family)
MVLIFFLRRIGMSFKKFKDLILGLVMLAFSGFYYFYATQIKTRPKLTPSYSNAQIIPKLLGLLLAALSLILIVQGIRHLRDKSQSEKKEKAEKNDVAAVALTFGLIIAYTILLANGLGFILSTIIYLFSQMLVLSPKEKRKPLLFAVIAVVFTFLVFIAFRIGLQQILPRGLIERLIGY